MVFELKSSRDMKDGACCSLPAADTILRMGTSGDVLGISLPATKCEASLLSSQDELVGCGKAETPGGFAVFRRQLGCHQLSVCGSTPPLSQFSILYPLPIEFIAVHSYS